jgi:hypothetical protein
MPVGDNAGAMAASAGRVKVPAATPVGRMERGWGMSERLRERIIGSVRCECIAERSEAIA